MIVPACLEQLSFQHKEFNITKEGKAYFYHELDQLGIKYWNSQTNFIMIKPIMDAKAFEAKMFAQGVMVRPVAGFEAPGCVSVIIGTPKANEAFISGLEKIIT